MRTCSVDGCERKHRARGFCKFHYDKKKISGEIATINHQEKHGMFGTPEYVSWYAMKTRCYNKKQKSYKDYGGRGITVCDRWKNSFTAFYKDMGPKPFPEAQIDRIENAGNYEPDNCKWESSEGNNQHRRSSKLNEDQIREIKNKYKTEKFTHRGLAKEYGVTYGLIGHILQGKKWKNIE